MDTAETLECIETIGFDCFAGKTHSERPIADSPFESAAFELVPIRTLRRLHSRFTREFTTAIVRCRLIGRTRNSQTRP
jgi:hypothetical protein